MIRHSPRLVLAAAAILLVQGCANDGLSPAELNQAAKERVSQALQLDPGATLFSTTYVGRSQDDPVLCGTVSGRRTDGTEVAPRRFIAATDPAEWVRFELPAEQNHSQYQFRADWSHMCAGAQEVE